MDDGFMPEDEQQAQRQIQLLSEQVDRGNMFSDWMRAPASVVFLKMLDDQIADTKNAWLAAPDRDKAEIVRIQSQVYLKIKQWIASQLLAGKVAQQGLKQFEDEGVVLANIIRPPQGPEAA